jgi:pyridoxal phosphate enzyme (YggS family)
VKDLERRLHEVRDRMNAACARAGRDPASVRLVAVSKTVPATEIAAAMAAGQTLFGENRVQEALSKMTATGAAATWHLVGHLQKNKAKHAVGRFELIHGVDDSELAEEISRRAAAASTTQRVLVQANLAGEAQKSGAGEDALLPLLDVVAGLPHLDLRGLMIIPPAAVDAEASRPWFRRLRELRDRVASRPRRIPSRAVDGHDRRLRDRHRGGSDSGARRTRHLRRTRVKRSCMGACRRLCLPTFRRFG